MTKIYEVRTELKDGTHYGTYRIAASNFEAAIKKITARELKPYPEHGERISELKILASEGS